MNKFSNLTQPKWMTTYLKVKRVIGCAIQLTRTIFSEKFVCCEYVFKFSLTEHTVLGLDLTVLAVLVLRQGGSTPHFGSACGVAKR